MKVSDVVSFAKKQGYSSAKFLNNWNGFEVYEPIYHENDTSFIGVPLVILVKDDIIRMSTLDEAFEQLDNSE